MFSMFSNFLYLLSTCMSPGDSAFFLASSKSTEVVPRDGTLKRPCSNHDPSAIVSSISCTSVLES
jgi:hypothetical protein